MLTVRKPRLVHARDEQYDIHERIVRESIPYAVHTVEEVVDPSRISIACAGCGGVTGAVDVYRDGVLLGRHRACTCRRHKRAKRTPQSNGESQKEGTKE